jgi:penicillin-binding protein 2
MSLHQAIVRSCNVFFYQAGAKIGAEAIAHYAQLFGLGQPTGVLLENEESGFIPTPAWKRKALRTKWYPGDTFSMSIGQGYISVTPLQVVNFVTAVANGGTLFCPKLVHSVLNSQGEVIQELPSQVVRKLNVAPKNLEIVQKGMFGVVNEYGTAARAMIPDIKVAGKTGTAQMVSLKDNGQKEDVPEELKDHAWFCGYAPFESPEIALVVFVEHGGKGGATCAPIAREVFLKYFQLKQERTGAKGTGAGARERGNTGEQESGSAGARKIEKRSNDPTIQDSKTPTLQDSNAPTQQGRAKGHV